MKKSIFILISICFFVIAQAQNPQWVQFMATTHIKSMAIEDEYLWAGTLSGLVKYNRIDQSLTFYNKLNAELPFNLVNALAVDIDDNLWIGMGNSLDPNTGGLAKFDGED